MRQNDVLDFLRRRRESGDDSFLSFTDIYEGMKRDGSSITYGCCNRMVNQLRKYDLLESNQSHRVYWRIKFRYPSKNKEIITPKEIKRSKTAITIFIDKLVTIYLNTFLKK